MSSTKNKLQAATGRLLLVAALMTGLLGLMLGPEARAAAGVTAGALSDAPASATHCACADNAAAAGTTA